MVWFESFYLNFYIDAALSSQQKEISVCFMFMISETDNFAKEIEIFLSKILRYAT